MVMDLKGAIQELVELQNTTTYGSFSITYNETKDIYMVRLIQKNICFENEILEIAIRETIKHLLKNRNLVTYTKIKNYTLLG